MSRNGLATRALAAVVLMIGFYVLALAIVGALAYIPYAEWTYAGRLHIKLALGCLIGAGAILVSIVPRPDRFEAPGPRLEEARHPQLFAKLRSIATRTGQAMPSEVYLVPDMNAWVSSRGGVMGFGSRRVMGIGLPLLHVTKVAEMEAVLAHEFGHYHGGDTRLGPWIYKTRSAIGRTLEALGDGWLQVPFRWYGNFFLRVTQAISRAQEFTADRLAATLFGPAALTGGLEKVHANANAFDAYWSQEALPVLNAGFHAPLGDGFAQFLRVPAVAQQVQSALAAELSGGGTPSPYDSHPPLAERIAAVRGLPPSPPRADADDPAVSLLRDPAAVEKQLLAAIAREGAKARFEPVAWDDVPERVLLPQWEAMARKASPVLATTLLGDLPKLVGARSADLVRAVYGPTAECPPDQLAQALTGPLGAAILLAVRGQGFALTAPPGEPPKLRRGDAELIPFHAASKLFDAAGAAEWSVWLEQNGLARVAFAAS